MKTFLKWAGIVLGVLAGVLVTALVVIYFKARTRLARTHELPEES